MREDSKNTCCLTLPLKIEKWQADRLIKRFEIARQIYNTLVHAELAVYDAAILLLSASCGIIFFRRKDLK